MPKQTISVAPPRLLIHFGDNNSNNNNNSNTTTTTTNNNNNNNNNNNAILTKLRNRSMSVVGSANEKYAKNSFVSTAPLWSVSTAFAHTHTSRKCSAQRARRRCAGSMGRMCSQ